jgi:hypothetical protein
MLDRSQLRDRLRELSNIYGWDKLNGVTTIETVAGDEISLNNVNKNEDIKTVTGQCQLSQDGNNDRLIDNGISFRTSYNIIASSCIDVESEAHRKSTVDPITVNKTKKQVRIRISTGEIIEIRQVEEDMPSNDAKDSMTTPPTVTRRRNPKTKRKKNLQGQPSVETKGNHDNMDMILQVQESPSVPSMSVIVEDPSTLSPEAEWAAMPAIAGASVSPLKENVVSSLDSLFNSLAGLTITDEDEESLNSDIDIHDEDDDRINGDWGDNDDFIADDESDITYDQNDVDNINDAEEIDSDNDISNDDFDDGMDNSFSDDESVHGIDQFAETDSVHWKNKKHRDELTRHIYEDFNRKVFNDKLPNEMTITWSSRLLTTGGTLTV